MDNKQKLALVLDTDREVAFRIKISYKTLQGIFGFFLLLLSFSFVLANNYLLNVERASAYEALLTENKDLSRQLLSLADKAQALDAQIENMGKVDSNIRSLLDEQDIKLEKKSQDKEEESSGSNTATQLVLAAPSIIGGGTGRTLSARRSLDRTLYNLENSLNQLEEAAKKQVDSLTVLEEDVKKYTAVLAATPNIWPARGIITSGFGYRRTRVNGYEFHTGVDISLKNGTPLRAPADGVIVDRGYRYSYGNTVIIDHGEGYTTLYAHLRSFKAKVGDTVKRGEVFAYSGNSGRSTGPHLHYEVVYKGVRQNPYRYLPR